MSDERSPIPPDTKDWTWVLQQPCPECGLAPGQLDVGVIPQLIRDNTMAWMGVLARPDVAARPRPDVWSPLEYGCHVRDVHRLFDQRLALMLAEDDPQFTNWDQDETAVADDYASQDPARVAEDLAEAGNRIADSFAAVHPDQWARPGKRSDGVAFTVESFARYFVHDPVHHLRDVRRA